MLTFYGFPDIVRPHFQSNCMKKKRSQPGKSQQRTGGATSPEQANEIFGLISDQQYNALRLCVTTYVLKPEGITGERQDEAQLITEGRFNAELGKYS